MKKTAVFIISILLISVLLFTMAGCDMFGFGGKNSDKDDKKAEEEAKKEKEKKEKQDLLAQYEALIQELKDAVADADSPEDYVSALLTVLQNLPKETLTDAVGMVAGQANAEIVEQYYDQIMTILSYADTFLPKMDQLLGIIRKYGNALNSVAGMLGLEANAGYNEATGTYTGFGYSFRKSEDERGNEVYTVTDNKNNKYEITFDMQKKAFYGNAGKKTEEDFEYELQTKLSSGDVYAQLIDYKNGKLFQLFIDIDKLEGTVSLSVAEEFPYEIIDSIPSGFATDGTIFTFNKDMLKDLRDFIA